MASACCTHGYVDDADIFYRPVMQASSRSVCRQLADGSGHVYELPLPGTSTGRTVASGANPNRLVLTDGLRRRSDLSHQTGLNVLKGGSVQGRTADSSGPVADRRSDRRGRSSCSSGPDPRTVQRRQSDQVVLLLRLQPHLLQPMPAEAGVDCFVPLHHQPIRHQDVIDVVDRHEAGECRPPAGASQRPRVFELREQQLQGSAVSAHVEIAQCDVHLARGSAAIRRAVCAMAMQGGGSTAGRRR